jgi:hypothetical protein
MYLLVGVCVVLMIVMMFLPKPKRKEQPNDLALFLTNEELTKTLQFMLMFGIIDGVQYNELMTKSLPYVKG